jgi:hypothetical protein
MIPIFTPELSFITSYMMSSYYEEEKNNRAPFAKRLLIDIKHKTKTEQELYEWIYKNWFFCYPQYRYETVPVRTTNKLNDFIGYQVIKIDKNFL